MAKKFYADGVRVAKATLYRREGELETALLILSIVGQETKAELREVRRAIKKAEGDTES